MLEDLLSKRKPAILKQWFNLIAQTHPDGGANLLTDKDRFTNPVGYTISSATNVLYEELLQGSVNSEKVTTSLDDITKIRAVQDLSPHQAIAIIFLLKKAIRAELDGEIREKREFGKLLEFESKIDELTLRAFDIYMVCRERIYEVKVDEMKTARDNAFRLLERTSLKLAGSKPMVAEDGNGKEVVE